MKTQTAKIVCTIIVGGLLAWMLISLIPLTKPNRVESDLIGEHTVAWEEVNLRTEPGIKSDVIKLLYKSETIHLTGRTFNYITDGKNPYPSWVEVQLPNNVKGWIVRESIQWH